MYKNAAHQLMEKCWKMCENWPKIWKKSLNINEKIGYKNDKNV